MFWTRINFNICRNYWATGILYANNIPTGQTINIPSSIIVNPTATTTYKINNISLQGCTNNSNSSQVTVIVTPGPANLTWTDSCNGGITTRTFTFNQPITYLGGSPTTVLAVPSNIGNITVEYGSGDCSLFEVIQVLPLIVLL